MSLSDLVNVTITASASSPTRPGFGTPLIAAYHTHYPDRVRTYSSTAAMVSDGFAVTDPAYLAASAVSAQNPKVQQFKIGRRALAPVQTLHLTMTDAVQNDVVSLQVGKPGATAAQISYTIPGAATTSTVATAVATLIAAAVTNTSASASGPVITMTVTAPTAADYLRDVKLWSSNVTLADVTADPGIQTDLANIFAADSNWYGLLLDSQSKAEVESADVWVEANGRLMSYNNSDGDCFNSGVSTDVFSALKSTAAVRAIGLFAGSQLLCYSGAAWMGNRFPQAPGSDTWAYKTLVGVPADNLSETQYTNIENKNGAVYIPLAGVNCTLFGLSGGGEYADITRFIDWLQSNIQIDVFTTLVNQQKVPYTNIGIALIKSTILGRLKIGVEVGGLVPGTIFVSTPDASAVPQADKLSRTLNNVTFTGQLQGAIHVLNIAGTLTF